ncbi:MAG TPA: VWA domain-containing protein [Pyrinomonadaceae bacterium]|nr:VWA domain-containing protein [Pyrinomonadaceae bacterium]
MKFILAIILASAISASAQSGRVKVPDTPSPTPKATPRTNANYNPTQLPDDLAVRPPVPTPTPLSDEGVIKIESTLVPIPTTVLDTNGRVITTLRLADFELKINGKPAEIGDLTRSESPIRLAMLFDNSSSVNIAREFEKRAAVKFFDRMIRPEKDLAALFSVATYTRLEQPLTSEVTLLTRAIEMFPTPVGATALLDGIIKAAEYLGEVQGRRVIVIVSDGDDTYSDSTLEQALRSLQVANCQVYVVKTTDFENYKRTGTRGGNANIHQLAAERRMLEVATQTGGRVYSPIDERELEEAFRQISAELSQQYILSYYPAPETDKRGEFREITLTVKGKPTVDVRTRKGYFVPKK